MDETPVLPTRQTVIGGHLSYRRPKDDIPYRNRMRLGMFPVGIDRIGDDCGHQSRASVSIVVGVVAVVVVDFLLPAIAAMTMMTTKINPNTARVVRQPRFFDRFGGLGGVMIAPM